MREVTQMNFVGRRRLGRKREREKEEKIRNKISRFIIVRVFCIIISFAYKNNFKTSQYKRKRET